MLAERLSQAREQTDSLFEMVKPEAIYDRPIGERHRIIFYLGHLEAFDRNLLNGGPESAFDRLFAFGIDPVGGGLPADKPLDWPSVDEVKEYNRETRAAIDRVTANNQLMNVAIEHRLMHAETLAYMLHQMPLETKVPQLSADVDSPPREGPSMITIPAGSVVLGRSEGFGWDNEFEAHRVDVPEFQIDRYKVTNGEFLEFLNAGGYCDQSLWTENGWKWKQSNDIQHPVFWKRFSNGWIYRTMFREIPMPQDWPVYVSHSEATAYARWVGKSLPTEAEWQKSAENSGTGNAGFRQWDPMPVTADPTMYGNGWEWTSTLFKPFPGFTPFPFYPGYSANFFDDQHYVMKGGSPRTADVLLRPSFRNWFQPNYQYVYTGFRCVIR